MATEKKFLGTLGTQQLITSIRAEFKAADEADLAAAKKYAEDLGSNYDAAGTAQTKVDALANGQVKTNTEHIGAMDDLETTAKSDLVKAINEVRNSVSAGGTAAAVTMEESSNPTEGVLKSYIIKQGNNTVGTINIPKDMVVQSGSVVVDPAGQPAGTYIKLVLANATNDEIFVNVGSLVDIYKAKTSASQVQLAIDASTREISATIVAGSIGSTELAANAVVTAKIADGNVTKAKLSADVQATLDKADAAAEDAQAKANAALAAAKEYADQAEADAVATAAADATGKADKALSDAKTYADGAKSEAKGYADELNTAMDARVKAVEADKHTHSNKTVLDGITADKVSAWDAAEQNAKDHAEDYADGLNTAMDNRVKALEDVTYTEITAAEVQAMFNA